MKIQMQVADVKTLDTYIDENTVPFAVCASTGENISKRQQRFLEKYYDRVVDKRGWVSFYCNIINAWKCRDMGYKAIEFPDGEEKKIQQYNLEKSESLNGKYVVVPYFKTGDKIDAVSLTKMIRLKVADMSKKLNEKAIR